MGKKGLNITEFKALLWNIRYNHRVGKNGKQIIKVTPVFNMDTVAIHRITLEGLDWTRVFEINTDESGKLLEQMVLDFLNS